AQAGGPQVAGDGGQAVGAAALRQQPTVRRRPCPFLAEPTARGDRDGEGDVAARQSIEDRTLRHCDQAQPARRARMLSAYLSGPPRKTALPATRAVAPAATQSGAVSGVPPPSTSRMMSQPLASII